MNILEEQYLSRFIGRGEKIKELKAKIKDNHIVVVKGNRGIGKTNLMHVVHKTLEKEGKDCHFVRAEFRDRMGEIFKPPWLNRIPVSLSALTVGVGVSLSKEETLRQSVKKSKEKIIFVENAHELDKEALENIFDAVCINNKLRFVLEVPTPHMRDFKLKAGSYSVINVEKLSHKDMLNLVRNAYYHFSNDVVEKIATKSDGYPYVARALVFICADKESNNRIYKFLDTLKDDEMYRLDQIHKEVLDTLREDAQGVIKMLAIAPQMLSYKLIEAFCGEEIDIKDIVERGILRTEEELYWIYHPLFRDYLRETPELDEKKKEIYCKAIRKIKSEFYSIHMLFEVLNEPDIFDELLKIVENYQALNHVAVQCYTWGKMGNTINLWSRILKKSQDEKNKEWEAIAIGNMGIVYQTKGKLDKTLEYYGKALKLNEELGSKEGIASQFGNMGNVYQIKGELDKALEYYRKALELNEELGRKEGIASLFGNMGIVYQIKGELDKALEYYRKALELNEELGSKEGIALQFGSMGIVYQIKGELDKTLGYYRKALKLNEELGRKEGIASLFGNMGIVYQIKGELDKALEYYRKALELNEELGRKEGIALQFGNMGNVYQIKGELDKALEYYGKALKLNEELGSKEGIALLFGNMGIVYQTKGKLDKTLEYYGKALKLNEELGSKEGIASQFGNMGNVYQIKGELDKALEYYGKALKLNEELGSKEGIALQFGNMGIVYGIKGELDEALEYYGKALKLNEELGRKEGIAIHFENMGIVYQTKGEFNKALEYYGKALLIFRNFGYGIQEARLLMLIGAFFIKRGDKERAIDYYLQAQELAVDSPSLFESINKQVNELLAANY